MSYWSENPEAYDECERDGIAGKLESFTNEPGDRETFNYLIDQLQNSKAPADKKLMDALREWANSNIIDRTSTYFDRFIP